MAAIDDVIEWAKKEIPDWQGDAVRRILTQEDLSAQDRLDLLAMLKERHGLGDAATPAPKPAPVEKGQVSGAPKAKVGVVLKALKDVKNVNAIPNDSYIPFGHEGLSVVYGENGAGKSGYNRILKRACSARDTTEPIHPNIFDEQPAGPASAIFKVGIAGGGDEEIPWTDGGAKSDALANIVVFDAKGARVIVDEENDISFLPYGTHVFERMISLLKDLRTSLEAERPTPALLAYKGIPPQTSSAKFLAALTAATSAAEIAAAIDWTDAHAKRLPLLKTKISEAESPDRNAKIRRLRSIVSLTRDLKSEISKIDAALPDTAVKVLRDAIDNAVAASQAVELAAKQSAGNEPLLGVGSAAWQALYNAAKDYSIQAAYPAKPFPVTEEGSRCVLCMQPLASDAQARLHRFHEFMEQEAKKKAARAEAALKTLMDELRALNFERFLPATDLAQEIKERDSGLADRISAYLSAMKTRANQMLLGGTQRQLTEVALATASPQAAVEQMELKISAELSELEKGLTATELQTLKQELQELEARQTLGLNKEEVQRHVELLLKVKNYNEAIAATNLNAISARGKKIISAAITPELQRALKVELEKLGAGHLPLDTKPTRSDGEVVHKLTLTKGKLPKKTPLTAILSEGEQRVVAVAGFLAELKITEGACPIVFDDPVSSLDHKFQGKIARRLAEVAQTRQVIVFTHDIGFLIDLQDCAAELGTVKLAAQTIRRKGMVPGYSAQGHPWHAMKVTERTELLLTKKLPKFEALHGQDMTKYNPAAAEVYGMLRETWEALVEDELLNKVVRRHSAAVKTTSLHEVEVNTPDYRTIHFGMKKCSEWMTGHDKSKALDQDRPDPKELRADIDSLLQFRKTIADRKKTLKDARAKAIEPATPAIG